MMHAHDMPAPERKSVPSGDLTAAFGEFMTTFETFRHENDQRLADLETRRGADVLTTFRARSTSRNARSTRCR